jgi:hypothetical protein
MLRRIFPTIYLTSTTDRLVLKENMHLFSLVKEWYEKVYGIYGLNFRSIGLKDNRFFIEYILEDEMLKESRDKLLADPDYEGKIPIMLGDIEYLIEGIFKEVKSLKNENLIIKIKT